MVSPETKTHRKHKKVQNNRKIHPTHTRCMYETHTHTQKTVVHPVGQKTQKKHACTQHTHNIHNTYNDVIITELV